MKLTEIFWIFLKLGLSSFGGPVAHLAYFRRAFVEQHKWFSEAQYAHLLTICQTIPGPASSQVGFAIGMLRAGWGGAICAFVAFTLPSILLLLIFASSLSFFDSTLGQAALQGLGILAFVVVLQAVIGMSKQLLLVPLSWLLALAMFCLVLLSESLMWQILGLLGCIFINCVFASHDRIDNSHDGSLCSVSTSHLSLRTTWISLSTFIGLLVVLTANPFNLNEYMYAQAPAYYVSGAMVFGGGHVVLPFLEQTTVGQNLLSEDVFLAGYGATQALPGPMFSFAAYLGYMTEISQHGFDHNNASVFRGVISGLTATIFIFLPGFLLISAVLPISQRLFVYSTVKRALTGANAAVVGLLAATLYDPIFTHAINNNHDVLIAGIAYIGLSKFKVPVLGIVCLCIILKIVFATL